MKVYTQFRFPELLSSVIFLFQDFMQGQHYILYSLFCGSLGSSCLWQFLRLFLFFETLTVWKVCQVFSRMFSIRIYQIFFSWLHGGCVEFRTNPPVPFPTCAWLTGKIAWWLGCSKASSASGCLNLSVILTWINLRTSMGGQSKRKTMSTLGRVFYMRAEVHCLTGINVSEFWKRLKH